MFPSPLIHQYSGSIERSSSPTFIPVLRSHALYTSCHLRPLALFYILTPCTHLVNAQICTETCAMFPSPLILLYIVGP